MKAHTSHMISLLLATGCCLHHDAHCSEKSTKVNIEDSMVLKYGSPLESKPLPRNQRIDLMNKYHNLMDEPKTDFKQRRKDLKEAQECASQLEAVEKLFLKQAKTPKDREDRATKVTTWKKRNEYIALELEYINSVEKPNTIAAEQQTQLKRIVEIATTLKGVYTDFCTNCPKAPKSTLTVWTQRLQDAHAKLAAFEVNLKHHGTVEALEVQYADLMRQSRNPNLSSDAQKALLVKRHEAVHALRIELPENSPRAQELLEQSCILNSMGKIFAIQDKENECIALEREYIDAIEQTNTIPAEQHHTHLKRIVEIATTLKEVYTDFCDNYPEAPKNNLTVWAQRLQDAHAKLATFEANLQRRETVKVLQAHHAAVVRQSHNPNLSPDEQKALLVKRHEAVHALRTELPENSPDAQQLLEESYILNSMGKIIEQLTQKTNELTRAQTTATPTTNQAAAETTSTMSTDTAPAMTVVTTTTTPVMPATATVPNTNNTIHNKSNASQSNSSSKKDDPDCTIL